MRGGGPAGYAGWPGGGADPGCGVAPGAGRPDDGGVTPADPGCGMGSPGVPVAPPTGGWVMCLPRVAARPSPPQATGTGSRCGRATARAQSGRVAVAGPLASPAYARAGPDLAVAFRTSLVSHM
ncbi:hypothetical protein GCM10022379_43600 [Micromonospora maritima]